MNILLEWLDEGPCRKLLGTVGLVLDTLAGLCILAVVALMYGFVLTCSAVLGVLSRVGR